MSKLQEIRIEYILYTDNCYQEINALCKSQYYNTIIYECAIRSNKIKQALEKIYQDFLEYKETNQDGKLIQECLHIFLENNESIIRNYKLTSQGIYPNTIRYYLSKKMGIPSHNKSTYLSRDIHNGLNRNNDGEIIEVINFENDGENKLYNTLGTKPLEDICIKDIRHTLSYKITLSGERPSINIKSESCDYIKYNKRHSIDSLIQQMKTIHDKYKEKLPFSLPSEKSCALMFFLYDRLEAAKNYQKRLTHQYNLEKTKIRTSNNTSDLHTLEIYYNDARITMKDVKAHIIEELHEQNITITIAGLERLLTKANKLINAENYKQLI